MRKNKRRAGCLLHRFPRRVVAIFAMAESLCQSLVDTGQERERYPASLSRWQKYHGAILSPKRLSKRFVCGGNLSHRRQNTFNWRMQPQTEILKTQEIVKNDCDAEKMLFIDSLLQFYCVIIVPDLLHDMFSCKRWSS